MGALVSGLLELFQWLAAVAGQFFSWLAGIFTSVLQWVWSVLGWLITTAWNLIVDLVGWTITAVFWLVGSFAELFLSVLLVLVHLLPEVPREWIIYFSSVVVPAYNVANQILPLSEAFTIGGIWLTFYGMMAGWWAITFIRGGR
ncbi:hypothetical protein [Thermus brockianus]|uniref:Uncharacterized protein n=1 Tax=Thermus brockianus TaxID=56956 RepID=A0ABM7XHJ4_THEBO|nr:hypothetical protein [Thermus brockianus]BDG15773.1 hypothetical protein TbrSNM41_05070 [Thermus brockianus]